MKKAGYIIGSIEIMIGTVLLSVASMIEKVLPILGRIAFQAVMAGSYSPSDYETSFPIVTATAALLIGFGLLQILFFGLIQKNK